MLNRNSMAALLCGLLVIACDDGKQDSGEDDARAGLDLSPPEGGQGTSMTVSFDASSSVFTYGDTTVDFGEGIQVDLVQVQDGWNLDVDITIEPDAALGQRDVSVESGVRDWTLAQAFNVIEESLTIEPDGGFLGETVEVELLGKNTEWEGGVTWPSFGDGVDILEFSVLSRTLAQATISVASDTYPGPRDVMMEDGPHVVTLYDGFQVDRVGLAASFDPEEAAQGDTVTFTIVGRGTNFSEGDTELAFWKNGDEKSDIVVDSLTVLDATNLYGKMTLSNAAQTGFRDVLISTPRGGRTP